MNQVTNRVQFIHLTPREKKEFDLNGYTYQRYDTGSHAWENFNSLGFASLDVYRLVIEDDKWYYCADEFGSDVRLGKDLPFGGTENLRPARPDEIPQQEKTLEQKIQEKWPDKEVVMLAYTGKPQELTFPVGTLDRYHFAAQSMKGFYRYVYEQDNDLIASLNTLNNWNVKTLQPVAVLFEE